MNLEDKKIAILSITNNGRELALKIKESMKNVDVFFIKKDTDYKNHYYPYSHFLENKKNQA